MAKKYIDTDGCLYQYVIDQHRARISRQEALDLGLGGETLNELVASASTRKDRINQGYARLAARIAAIPD